MHRLIKVYPLPVLIASSSIVVDDKTQINYISNALIKIFNGELRAKEVEMNLTNGVIIAKSAKFIAKCGAITVSEFMAFDNSTGSFWKI